jgi:hypothetical protein
MGRRYRIEVNRPLALLTILAAGCAAPAPTPDFPLYSADAAWRYDVTVADDLARIDVALTFRDFRPRELVVGDARGLTSITATTLRRDGDALVRVGDEATIAYRVDLTRLAESGAATRVGRSVCASPGLWLLRPRSVSAGELASLVLHLPDGVTATTPWPRRADGTYLLDESTFRWRAFAAFGQIETRTIDVAGAALDVAVLDRPHAATWTGIEAWIAAAARAQASLFGSFPVARAQIVVKPVASDQAVPFGETLRGGGPAVVLFPGDETTDAALASDWVAIHEFTHLGMPAIAESDAWLAEGFVSYYQCVLRRRAGFVDERAAWQELVDGFARGRAAHGATTLGDESATMNHAHAFPAVYWGGAALALALDVELRRTSDGRRSLDDAMREIRRAFGGRTSEVAASEIVAHLDAWLGRPMFSDVTSRALASKEFPATDETLARLGVVVEDGRVTRIDDAAPDAAVRRGIVGTTAK